MNPANGILSRPQVDLTFLSKSPQQEEASTHRSTFSGLRGAFDQSPRFRSTRSAWTQAYSLPCYLRLDTGVEHALLEKLTFFIECKHCSRRRRHTQVKLTSMRKCADKCGRSQVNAGTAPETKYAGTQGRPVPGFSNDDLAYFTRFFALIPMVYRCLLR